MGCTIVFCTTASFLTQIRQGASIISPRHLPGQWQPSGRQISFIVTFGTAYLYRLRSTGEVVANCHKFPADSFIRERLSVEEIVKEWDGIINRISALNPDTRIIFTVSPSVTGRMAHTGIRSARRSCTCRSTGSKRDIPRGYPISRPTRSCWMNCETTASSQMT